MEQIFTLAAEKLSGWDFIIAGIIVCTVEYCIKPFFKNVSEKTWNIVVKLAPIVLGAVFYLVLALIQKGVWYTSLAHGLLVGLASMGNYDAILKTMKSCGKKSITDTNEAVKKAIEEKIQ